MTVPTATPDVPALIFETPPPPAQGRVSPITFWLDELRNHPGQWARYPEPAWSSAASHIKAGTQYGAKKGEFEAVARTIPGEKKKYTLYVRYIGNAPETAHDRIHV